MTRMEPITGTIPGDWPILDADTPIFNQVAIDLGLIDAPGEPEPAATEPANEPAEESTQDTGDPTGGEQN